jgi:tRNA A-37 threonylcarbamoyl transferase component Bud32
MNSEAVSCGELPLGYVWEHRGRVSLAVLEEEKRRLLALPLHDTEALLSLPGVDTTKYRGRGGVASVPLAEGSEERMIVRRYRHGGLLRVLTRDWLLGPRRPLRELTASQDARDRRVPTTEVLAASVERRFFFLYHGALFTRELRQSRDLDSVLVSLGGCTAPRDLRRKREILRASAAAVRALHDGGIFHADLNLKNLVIQEQAAGPRALVIDLDGARSLPSLSWSRRWKNLFRLHRSLRKRPAARRSVTTTDSLRFLVAYLGRTVRRDHDLRRRIRWHRLSLFLHGLFWRRGQEAA